MNGIWIQDWVGSIQTPFGTRLFWDWKLNETQYPGIIEVMQEKEPEGVYFMAYINPYLNDQGDLFQEANMKGEKELQYLVDFHTLAYKIRLYETTAETLGCILG